MQPGDRGFAKFEREFARLKNTVEELQAEIDETQTTADFLQDGNIRVRSNVDAIRFFTLKRKKVFVLFCLYFDDDCMNGKNELMDN